MKKLEMKNGESKTFDNATISVMASGGTATIIMPDSPNPMLGIVVEDEEGEEYVLVIPPEKEIGIVRSLLHTFDDLNRIRNQ